MDLTPIERYDLIDAATDSAFFSVHQRITCARFAVYLVKEASGWTALEQWDTSFVRHILRSFWLKSLKYQFQLASALGYSVGHVNAILNGSIRVHLRPDQYRAWLMAFSVLDDDGMLPGGTAP